VKGESDYERGEYQLSDGVRHYYAAGENYLSKG
jgi:hypothetical protein